MGKILSKKKIQENKCMGTATTTNTAACKVECKDGPNKDGPCKDGPCKDGPSKDVTDCCKNSKPADAENAPIPEPLKNVLQNILGDKVQLKDGTVTSLEEFKTSCKYIGVYISAHWCGPCRLFTPALMNFYQIAKEKGLEIVFISCDHGEDAFDQYYASMPWQTIPYDNEETRMTANQKLGARGIPNLVFFDTSTNQIIHSNGRELVQKDLKAEKFPWN